MTKFKKFSTPFIFGLLCLVIASCSEQKTTQKYSPSQVSSAVVNKAEIPITYEYAARIVPFREVQVRSRVSGILLKRNFIEGSEVKQGEVLFEIDPDLYNASVAAAQSQVAQAQANYDQSVRDANRAEELVVQKVQSTAMRDQAFTKRDADQATLMQTQAQLQTAELNLGYTNVTAPISGLTSRDVVSEGSLIGTDASSSLLTTITQLDPVYVNFSFADDDYEQIRTLIDAMKARGEPTNNLKITIHLTDSVTYPQQGTIDFTSPTIDENTGTIGARAIVENPDHRLLPGMFVRVTVTGLTMANAITIPEEALMQNSSGQFVYLLKPMQAPTNNNQANATPKATTPEAEAAAQAAKAAMMAELKKGGRLMQVEQRPVQVTKQLPDGKWLIATAQTDSKAKNNTIKGLQSGDEIVTQGQVYIEQGMMRMPPGQPFVVRVTEDTKENQENSANTDTAEPAK